MADWTEGYVAEVGYIYGYYGELNPLRARLALLHSGFAAPTIDTACELGFGQGLSINIHAAATPVQWYGTDFNPAQVTFARELAAASSADIALRDEAFADFAQRNDLPDFDFIGLHGIWSWISNDNRAVIIDFIRRKLKVGGLLYISYNTLPGWAAFAPLRHLMTEHIDKMGGGHALGLVDRINGAIDFVDKFFAANPAYLRAHPQLADRLALIKGQNRHYLAHEYFNRDWDPMHFATLARWLEPAKVSFACSADYMDHYDVFNLTSEQSQYLSTVPMGLFRQSVRDFLVNQQFRRDYWIKGARLMGALERLERLRAERVILVSHRPTIAMKVARTPGEITLQPAIYEPILDLLASHVPKTLGEIEQALAGKGMVFNQIVEAAITLTGLGHVAPVQTVEAATAARARTDRLNNHLLQIARSSGDISLLASPVAASGVEASRFQQLFLLALSQGRRAPSDWAAFTWQLLELQGQRIVKDGKQLETAEQNLAELNTHASAFAERLPILKALQIA
jgi:SAM-dependent methyltransferase